MVAGLLPLIAFAALSVVTIIVLAWYAKKGLDEIFKKPNVEARVYIPTPEELAEDAKKRRTPQRLNKPKPTGRPTPTLLPRWQRTMRQLS